MSRVNLKDSQRIISELKRTLKNSDQNQVASVIKTGVEYYQTKEFTPTSKQYFATQLLQLINAYGPEDASSDSEYETVTTLDNSDSSEEVVVAKKGKAKPKAKSKTVQIAESSESSSEEESSSSSEEEAEEEESDSDDDDEDST